MGCCFCLLENPGLIWMFVNTIISFASYEVICACRYDFSDILDGLLRDRMGPLEDPKFFNGIGTKQTIVIILQRNAKSASHFFVKIYRMV
ncbi:hypothetical protein E2542_SST12833 [Spatholobus suberectus]|nr:hypothetical protein E2542_SST12833 [Spatholobus suberectus]